MSEWFEGWTYWQWFVVIGIALVMIEVESCSAALRSLRDELRRKL